jgi:hypothetical protein
MRLPRPKAASAKNDQQNKLFACNKIHDASRIKEVLPPKARCSSMKRRPGTSHYGRQAFSGVFYSRRIVARCSV